MRNDINLLIIELIKKILLLDVWILDELELCIDV